MVNSKDKQLYMFAGGLAILYYIVNYAMMKLFLDIGTAMFAGAIAFFLTYVVYDKYIA